MNSNILNKIGLGNIDPGIFILALIVISIVCIIVSIVMIKKVSDMNKRLSKFTEGKNAESLEDDIAGIKEDNTFVKAYIEQNKKDIRKIYKNLEISYQKLGLVRYDAFKETGGQMSFALCLLNDKDNGFIINSVHSVNGCYSYSKAVKGGQSELALGDEEKEALEKALTSVRKPAN